MSQPSAAGGCRHVELKVPSVTGSICVVRAVVDSLLATLRCSNANITLAIDEALANVIRHGYDNEPDLPIDVDIRCTDEHPPELAVTIRHYGRQVDPATIKGRDLEDVRPGGLGVHIIQSVMDVVEYSCPPDGGMLVRLVKRLASADEAQTDSGE
jgi:anti-sigma regulatory factor (Ser/Thr protein kinase)